MNSLYWIRVIDTETTGLPKPEKRAGLVEIGYTDIRISGDRDAPAATLDITISEPVGQLINPGIPIDAEASGQHHLRDRDLIGAPSPDSVFIGMYEPRIDCFAAHNAEFDMQFYGGSGKPWICTKRTAIMALSDGNTNVKNQTLRYVFGIDDEPDFLATFAMRPHRAPDDSYVTAFILRSFIRRGVTIQQMCDWTQYPLLLPKYPMNPHKGRPWSEVPKTMINWAMTKSDARNDRDFAHTARFWLRQ